jgi:hypothetical protein
MLCCGRSGKRAHKKCGAFLPRAMRETSSNLVLAALHDAALVRLETTLWRSSLFGSFDIRQWKLAPN